MRRFLPKSLIGQIALVMAVALLIAQAINFTLIFTERQRVSRAQIEGPAVSRFIFVAQRIAEVAPEERENMLPRRGRRGRFTLDAESPLPAGADDATLLGRLRDSAQASGLSVRDSRAAISETVPVPSALRERLPAADRERIEQRMRRSRTLILSVQLPDGSWFTGRIVTPRPNPWAAVRPLVATLLTYLIILAAMIWIARRLGRPLRDLAGAAERFHGRGEAPRVEPRGPADLNRAILAFNAMSARVGAMLDEKDRMLGAIGHDLRTPLASLRIRAETVEPDEDRVAMIATIEEMSAMLDDTLALARSGRAVEELRVVDIAALADTVVEEYRALGADVALEEGANGSATVQSRLLRRAVRNLVANAVAYAGAARITVRTDTDDLLIEVSDAGPGIAEAELQRVLDPFYRIEPSRNRETGGAGLGLTLARAAAQAHGGDLELENRPTGGLVARLRIRRELPREMA
ncbi:MAG: sensor histidine kinase [Sphingomonas sp.]